MNNALKMILVLVIVSSLSGAGLVLVYSYAQPQIIANQNQTLEGAIFKVVPTARTYRLIKKDGEEIYVAEGGSGRIAGYAILARGNGYQGEIVIIAGLDAALEKILDIEILESVETPGLGDMIKSDDFKNQFKNLAVLPQINLTKKKTARPNEIQAITGATISSTAVVEILNGKIKKIRELLK